MAFDFPAKFNDLCMAFFLLKARYDRSSVTHLNHIGHLAAEIEARHECDTIHKETVFVRENVGGEKIWEGYVEVFDLIGHKDARICYAWWHTQDDGILITFAILGNSLINSANKAVSAAIFVDKQPISFPRPAAESTLTN